MRKVRIGTWMMISSYYYCIWIMAFAFGLLFLGHHLSRSPSSSSSSSSNIRPIFAYSITGTAGDGDRILRLLKATYHRRNRYLLQLDAASSERERDELALRVGTSAGEGVFLGNVDVVGGGGAGGDEVGPASLAVTLRAAALLLKMSADWDWFIALSASDYPLITQHDLLHAFTFMPRNLNFIHYNTTRWREIVIDSSLYSQKRASVMYAVETREKPEAFTVFGGSPRMILARDLMEYCVKGWDNFPRKLLMYFTNMAYPLESYFHTILCNTQEFRHTIVDTDLSYMVWDSTIDDFQFLTMSHFDPITLLPSQSGVAASIFARPFLENDPVLDEIDQRILNRNPRDLVSGNISRSEESDGDERSACSNRGLVVPSFRGVSLKMYLTRCLEKEKFKSLLCSVDND